MSQAAADSRSWESGDTSGGRTVSDPAVATTHMEDDTFRRRRNQTFQPIPQIMSSDDERLARQRRSRVWWTVWILVALILIWIGLSVTARQLPFPVLSPTAKTGMETAAAFCRLFAALVLILFPVAAAQRRLRWVAAGFLSMALGGLFFAYANSLPGIHISANSGLYGWLVIRDFAGILFGVGLVFATPPRLSRPVAIGLIGVLVLLTLGVVAFGASLPALAHGVSLKAATDAHLPLRSLTGWYWTLSLLALTVALAAAVGAALRYRDGVLGGWLLLAMVLVAGSQLSSVLWPTSFQVPAPGDMLRVLGAAVVAVGATLELRGIAVERSRMLRAVREEAQRLAELTVIKADFSDMVAHELGSPLAAIRRYVDMLGTRDLGAEQKALALGAIKGETDLIESLMEDGRTAARVERDDFAPQLRRVGIDKLLQDAAEFAGTLSGTRALTVSIDGAAIHEGENRLQVWADGERIGQVLRNLLMNAIKYSPDGSPIEIRAHRKSGCCVIEVVDRGIGIHAEDRNQIFRKFGRGRDATGKSVPGIGLGLYICQRIVRAHGSDIVCKSVPGQGSTFSFELPLAE